MPLLLACVACEHCCWRWFTGIEDLGRAGSDVPIGYCMPLFGGSFRALNLLGGQHGRQGHSRVLTSAWCPEHREEAPQLAAVL